MKIIYTHIAIRDLKRLREFIAKKNPQSAHRYSEQLRNTIKKLTLQPLMGRLLDEASGTRELIAGNYLARYIIKSDQVIIIKIRHSKELP